MPLDLERRRNATEIVLDAVRLFFGHAHVFFVATLVVVAPVVIVVDGILGRQFADGFDADAPLGVTLLSNLLSSFLLPALVTAIHVRAVQGLADGVEPQVGGVLRQAVALAPAVLPAIVLYTLGVAVGFVLLVIPGLFLSIRWYFNAQSVVVDGRRGTDALKASGELVQGSWWRVFGTLLLLGICAGFVGYFIGGLLGALVRVLSDSGAWYVAVEVFGQTIALSISALGGTLLFFDLRREHGLTEQRVGDYLPPVGL